MLSYCPTLITQFATIENAYRSFFKDASVMSSTHIGKARRSRALAAGVALSPQQVALTRDLTSVHLKAGVKGFQEQKTDWSCSYYLWRNEALKKYCQNFVNFSTSRCTVEIIKAEFYMVSVWRKSYAKNLTPSDIF